MLTHKENAILAFVSSVLNDDNGISENAYMILLEIEAETGETEFGERFSALVSGIDATDGRFYTRG